MTRDKQDIREQIFQSLAFFAMVFMAHTDSKISTELYALYVADFPNLILNIKCSRGGGVCLECSDDIKGKRRIYPYRGATNSYLVDCLTCKGTGLEEKVTFTVLEAVEAAEEGKICGGKK